jgi:hypothetical protein
LPFLDIPTSFNEFWKFETIYGIYLNKKKKKKARTSHGPNPAHGLVLSAWRPSAVAGRRGLTT